MLIQTSTALREFCAAAAGARFLAVDTEFKRERTYFAELCLVQVAFDDRMALVDPLAEGIDLGPLFECLRDRATVKVIHSASQDLEILLPLLDEVPAPLFDTQVAASLCGYPDQIAYAGLVQAIDGETLDKGEQRTDWSRRPLSERQLAYALADVSHLGSIYRTLTEELERRGRTDWATEEMQRLEDRSRYEIDPRAQWHRIRVRQPTPRILAILREVAAWRELEARRRDLPRSWVIKDEALIEIARCAPRDDDELAALEGAGNRLARSERGDELLAAVARAAALDESACPRVQPPPDARMRATLKALQALLRERAERYEIAAPVIARRSELESFAAEADHAPRFMEGWRREVFGETAAELREQRLSA